VANTCPHVHVHVAAADVQGHANGSERRLARGVRIVPELLRCSNCSARQVTDVAKVDLLAGPDAQHLRRHEHHHDMALIAIGAMR